MNANQLEEKRAHELAVQEIEDQIAAEEDDAKKEVLKVELNARQEKLDALIERFAKTTLETALSGEAPRVSQMRRSQMDVGAGGTIPNSVGPIQAPMPMPSHQGHYNPRYNPTQHYAGPGQYSTAGRTSARGFSGYVPRGGRHSGNRGGQGGQHYAGGANAPVPEWAQEEYGPPSGSTPSRSYPYERAANGSGGYLDSTDLGFYDQPVGPPGGRGRGRGRGRGYYEATGGSASYYGAPGGPGVGGEIQFDTFAGQDRY